MKPKKYSFCSTRRTTDKNDIHLGQHCLNFSKMIIILFILKSLLTKFCFPSIFYRRYFEVSEKRAKTVLSRRKRGSAEECREGCRREELYENGLIGTQIVSLGLLWFIKHINTHWQYSKPLTDAVGKSCMKTEWLGHKMWVKVY